MGLSKHFNLDMVLQNQGMFRSGSTEISPRYLFSSSCIDDVPNARLTYVLRTSMFLSLALGTSQLIPAGGTSKGISVLPDVNIPCSKQKANVYK